MLIDVAALTSGALGFTVALAWNDAIGRTVRSFIPSAALATLVYAIVVTLLVIAVVAALNHTRRLAFRRHCRRNGIDPAPYETATAKKSTGLVQLWAPQQIIRPTV